MCPIHVYILRRIVVYMFMFFYAHVRPIHVYAYFCAHISTSKFCIHTRPFTYTCLHTTMPIYLYMYIYFYVHISLHFYTPIRPYSYICQHTSTPLYGLTMFTIILHQYTPCIRSKISTPIYAANMFTYFYAHKYTIVHIFDDMSINA
jgi:hypothetical protein